MKTLFPIKTLATVPLTAGRTHQRRHRYRGEISRRLRSESMDQDLPQMGLYEQNLILATDLEAGEDGEAVEQQLKEELGEDRLQQWRAHHELRLQEDGRQRGERSRRNLSDSEAAREIERTIHNEFAVHLADFRMIAETHNPECLLSEQGEAMSRQDCLKQRDRRPELELNCGEVCDHFDNTQPPSIGDQMRLHALADLLRQVEAQSHAINRLRDIPSDRFQRGFRGVGNRATIRRAYCSDKQGKEREKCLDDNLKNFDENKNRNPNINLLETALNAEVQAQSDRGETGSIVLSDVLFAKDENGKVCAGENSWLQQLINIEHALRTHLQSGEQCKDDPRVDDYFQHEAKSLDLSCGNSAEGQDHRGLVEMFGKSGEDSSKQKYCAILMSQYTSVVGILEHGLLNFCSQDDVRSDEATKNMHQGASSR